MKKFVKVLLVSLMALSLFGCQSNTETPEPTGAPEPTKTPETQKSEVSLKVWGSQEDQSMLNGMIDEFKAANPDKVWNIELGVVSEADAKTKYLEDPAAAADVFAFANDQLRDLVNAGGLYKVTRNTDNFADVYAQGTIDAASIDGQLYAYPMTADNGYFMYYDSRVLSAEDVLSFETMLDKADAAGKKIFMDISNGWYIASFFLGSGGTLTLDADGHQQTDFNNANGLLAGEAIKRITSHPAFLTGDDSVLIAGLTDGTIAAGVSGTWNAEAVSTALQDGYAASKLPSYEGDGKQIQMGSFAGYKFIGVNSQTQAPVEAMDLAAWLTNEKNQTTRFEQRKMGPANVNVAKGEAVKADKALAALAAQSEFATSQKDVTGTYWGPAEAFGTTLEAKDYTKSVQELLDDMVLQITTVTAE